MREQEPIRADLYIDYQQLCMMVERETSEVARRERDKDGNSLYEDLVMDSQYNDILNFAVKKAGAVINDTLSAYLDPNTTYIYENGSIINDESLRYSLIFPPTFIRSNIPGINTSIHQYIVSYVCHEWYSAKLPEIAELYRVRMDAALQDIKHRLNMRVKPITRPYKII